MRHGKNRFLVGALTAPLLLYAVFVVSPYAQAFYLAFTDWNGLSGQAVWVGASNFTALWSDPLFLAALRNNGLMLLIVPPAVIALALFFAAMLTMGRSDRHGGVAGVQGSGVYRIVYFFPQLLSVAILAILFQFVYTPNNGLLNGLLEAVGLGALSRSWLAEPAWALPAVMAVMIWAAVGFYVVLFAAAMESIPRDVLEAARLDGAGRLTTFRRITVPYVWDTVQVAYVYLGILALDGLALVQIMTVGPGGPDNATEVIGLTLYRAAFSYGKFGYASAMGVTLFFLTLTLTAVALRATRRERVEAV
ncbi:sugar ABC transporter permease [Glycomyces halotolerans]